MSSNGKNMQLERNSFGRSQYCTWRNSHWYWNDSLFTWIFLLDSAFVIFNNLPPRMVIKEIRMHMATPEACFQATTADQCHHQLQLFLPARSLYWTTSFRGSFESLCKDDLSANIRHLLATLGPLNLFTLTSGKLQFKPPWFNLVNTVCNH